MRCLLFKINAEDDNWQYVFRFGKERMLLPRAVLCLVKQTRLHRSQARFVETTALKWAGKIVEKELLDHDQGV